MIRVRFCSGSEYFKNKFVFGSSSVNVGFGFGSILGITWVRIRFVLDEFGLFPISTHDVLAHRSRAAIT